MGISATVGTDTMESTVNALLVQQVILPMCLMNIKLIATMGVIHDRVNTGHTKISYMIKYESLNKLISPTTHKFLITAETY